MKDEINRDRVNHLFRHLCMGYIRKNSENNNFRVKKVETINVSRQINELKEQLLTVRNANFSRILQRLENIEDNIHSSNQNIDYIRKTNDERINQIMDKIDSFIDQKNERDNRMKALEEKIRSNSDKQLNEVIELEKKILTIKPTSKNKKKVSDLKKRIKKTKKKLKR